MNHNNCNCDGDEPKVIVGSIESKEVQKHLEGLDPDAIKPKGRSVANIMTKGGKHIGVSDVIRWGDVITAYGEDIDISKAVLLGLHHKIPIAETLKKDLKSKEGLLVTFPIAQLLDELKHKEDNGRTLLKKLKV